LKGGGEYLVIIVKNGIKLPFSSVREVWTDVFWNDPTHLSLLVTLKCARFNILFQVNLSSVH
jgi:hypothetical protein